MITLMVYLVSHVWSGISMIGSPYECYGRSTGKSWSSRRNVCLMIVWVAQKRSIAMNSWRTVRGYTTSKAKMEILHWISQQDILSFPHQIAQRTRSKITRVAHHVTIWCCVCVVLCGLLLMWSELKTIHNYWTKYSFTMGQPLGRIHVLLHKYSCLIGTLSTQRL